MSRFFVPKEFIKNDIIHIIGSEAKHIIDVMRLKENDNVVVFDGTGKEYIGFIKKILANDVRTKSKMVEVKIIKTDTSNKKLGPKITLVQSIPKKDKMDYIVEKTTELGVHRIVPTITERTIIKLKDDKALKRVQRWKKIAIEASKQCGRREIPYIEPVQEFMSFMDNMENFDLSLMACLSEDTIELKESTKKNIYKNIIIFIGPEGDFTKEEIERAKEKRVLLVSLGSRILKVDTAAISLISILQYEFTQS